MSTFKFNFSGEDKILTNDESNNEAKIEWLESQEIFLTNQITNLDKIADRAKIFVCGDVEIGHIVVKNNAALQEETIDLCSMIKLSQQEHSDLIAGKYEGGMKIWECTSDLIEYLEEENNSVSFKDKNVLDLGCGAGILGIYAFMNGSNVTFQDYNQEVIEHVTISNVLLNIEEDERESEIKRCRFYSGDWESFNKISDDVYDIILTSETIYNTQNYKKLLKIFCDKINKNGEIYVAAKTYYFGVGGGTRQFEQSLKDNGQLESKVCWKSTEGIQREIIKITRSVKT